MFERRLRLFATLIGLLCLVIVIRLIDIQVVHASFYQEIADRQLTRPTHYLKAARGSILDRHGRVLVSDEPASDVSVHFAVLAGESERYLRAFARQMRRDGRAPADEPLSQTVEDLRHKVAETWVRLGELSGLPPTHFLELGERLKARVRKVRAEVAARTGIDQPIAEEQDFHPVLPALPEDLVISARLALGDLPWVEVAPATRRVAHDADELVHVLGRVGPATAERLRGDPLADDPLRGLRANEQCGVSGVERTADVNLRGTRGQLSENFEGSELQRSDPRRGRDVRLTIDAALQKRVYELLREGVLASEHPAGGAAVVIDVATRDVLALVSFPTYSYAEFAERYPDLERDTRWQPLRFRAVANQYPPGSTCKAITLVGGLMDGVVTPGERVHCNGHLLPSKPNQFRCWIYNQFGSTHDGTDRPDGQSGEDAVRNSCNIYFFKVGERLGPGRLCKWFGRFGLGRLQGTGLIEETPGINPTEGYLRALQGRGYATSDAWNFAIGQGEVTVTPLQSANIAASAASGRWAPVRLVRDDGGIPLVVAAEPEKEFDERAVRVLRRGMWRVVNEQGGTATAARLNSPTHVLCGKTGSAQTVPRVINYRFTLEYPDGRRETRVAIDEAEALRAVASGEQPRVVGKFANDRFPAIGPEDKLPSHAWFIGYTQAIDTPEGARPSGESYAIAVIVEFGGSGGKVAGPIAKRIAEELIGVPQWGAAPAEHPLSASRLPVRSEWAAVRP